MGWLDDSEEKLKQSNRELDAKVSTLKNEIKRLNHQLEKAYADLNKKDSDNRDAVECAVQKALARAGIDGSKLTWTAYLIRAMGLLFISVSLVYGFILVTQQTTNYTNYTTWSIYIFCQFGGLYMCGYGKALSIKSFQIFGLYMITLFLIVVVSIGLAIFGQIDIDVNTNVIIFVSVNAIGIPLLVYLEREERKLAAEAGKVSPLTYKV